MLEFGQIFRGFVIFLILDGFPVVVFVQSRFFIECSHGRCGHFAPVDNSNGATRRKTFFSEKMTTFRRGGGVFMEPGIGQKPCRMAAGPLSAPASLRVSMTQQNFGKNCLGRNWFWQFFVPKPCPEARSGGGSEIPPLPLGVWLALPSGGSYLPKISYFGGTFFFCCFIYF